MPSDYSSGAGPPFALVPEREWILINVHGGESHILLYELIWAVFDAHETLRLEVRLKAFAAKNHWSLKEPLGEYD